MNLKHNTIKMLLNKILILKAENQELYKTVKNYENWDKLKKAIAELNAEIEYDRTKFSREEHNA